MIIVNAQSSKTRITRLGDVPRGRWFVTDNGAMGYRFDGGPIGTFDGIWIAPSGHAWPISEGASIGPSRLVEDDIEIKVGVSG